MRCALFARYSSKLQDEMSLDAQLAEMETFCSREQLQPTHRYLLPETASGVIEKDDTFQAMIAAAKRREFDVLLVHKLDRFGRSRETSVTYKALLRRHGVQVRSVVENLGEGIFDRLIEGILEVVAEFYSLNLGQETRKGHVQLTRKGYWRGGAVPFGLHLVEVEDGGKTRKQLAVDPQDGPVMIHAFEMVARGQRAGEVLDFLEGATGERPTHPTLYTRLKNPIYYGRLEYGKTKLAIGGGRKKCGPEDLVVGEWEGLVSKDLWDRAQAEMTKRHRGQGPAHRKAPASVYMLTEGVASCSACGKHLIGGRFGGHARYRCAGQRAKTCTGLSVRADWLEPRVHTAALDLFASVDLRSLVERYAKSLEPEREQAKKREGLLRRELADARKKKRGLFALAEQGLVSADLAERIRQLEQTEAELAQEIGTCQLEADQAVTWNVAMVEDYLTKAGERVRTATAEELKLLYRDLFRLEFDLEKQTGQLFLQLAGGSGRSVKYGRSAPSVITLRPPRILVALVA